MYNFINPFPELLAYALWAPFFIRIILGATLLYFGFKNPNARSGIVRTLKIIAGILIILGVYTQIGAVIAIVLFGALIIHKLKQGQLFTAGVNYYALLFVMALSLLFLGAGHIALDMPL